MYLKYTSLCLLMLLFGIVLCEEESKTGLNSEITTSNVVASSAEDQRLIKKRSVLPAPFYPKRSNYYKRINLPFKWGKRSDPSAISMHQAQPKPDVCKDFFATLINEKSQAPSLVLAKLNEYDMDNFYNGCFKSLLKQLFEDQAKEEELTAESESGISASLVDDSENENESSEDKVVGLSAKKRSNESVKQKEKTIMLKRHNIPFRWGDRKSVV